jgi:hypothetical protein
MPFIVKFSLIFAFSFIKFSFLLSWPQANLGFLGMSVGAKKPLRGKKWVVS